MKLVIQRVNHASVTVNGSVTGQIGKGYLVFLGIGEGDTKEMADRYVDKLSKLRIFPDANGKTNLSLSDAGGQILVVSQFTLYADCRKGNRPSCINAAPPETAAALYEYFLERCRAVTGSAECGVFGADMKISLENDGPFTIIWDSKEW